MKHESVTSQVQSKDVSNAGFKIQKEYKVAPISINLYIVHSADVIRTEHRKQYADDISRGGESWARTVAEPRQTCASKWARNTQVSSSPEPGSARSQPPSPASASSYNTTALCTRTTHEPRAAYRRLAPPIAAYRHLPHYATTLIHRRLYTLSQLNYHIIIFGIR